ncbi:MAG: trigger factor [Clostridiales bacterium]|nr:trigger factor [Clostridiales bacterium]
MKIKIKTKLIINLALSLLFLILLVGCSESLNESKDYAYDDLSKYLKLGEYKGLEYEKIDVQVTQAEVQQYIDEAILNSSKTEQKKEGIVESDSVVNIDYVGSLKGVEFEGGAAEDTTINIADNNFIPGFVDEIIGHKVGETFNIKVTFPENYGNDELAGQNTVFKIKINYIEVAKHVEYNDNWVKKNTDFSYTSDYEKSVKDDIEDSKKQDAASKEKQELLSKIMENSEVISYPKKEYDSRYKQIVDRYKSIAESNDIKFDDYLKNEMGITQKQFKKLAKDTAEKVVKQELILHSIARAEKIEITDQEYNDYLSKFLKELGYTEETYKEEYGYTINEYAESNNFFTSYLYKRVMNKVMEYSKAK